MAWIASMGADSSSATACVNDVRMFFPTSVLPVKKVIVPSGAICSHASRLVGRGWPPAPPPAEHDQPGAEELEKRPPPETHRHRGRQPLQFVLFRIELRRIS